MAIATPVTRITGRELQRRRARLFAAHPYCVTCLPLGIETRSTIREHIIPLREGGTEDESNEQALCLDCFDRKKEREAERGGRPSALAECFRKSATPRDRAGMFRVRRRPL